VKTLKAQVLIELLIVIGLFSILAAGLAGVVSVSSKAKVTASYITQARSLLQQYREAIFTISFNDWNKFENLNKSSSSFYYLYSTSGSWEINSGKEIFNFQEKNVERYFYVEKVWRFNNIPTTTNYGDINFDPATLKFTIVVSVENYKITDEFFLTKWKNTSVFQSSWGGGPGVEGPLKFFSNYFSSSSNIKYDDEKIQLSK